MSVCGASTESWFGSDLALILSGLLSDGPADEGYRRGLETLRRLFGAGVWSVEDLSHILGALARAHAAAEYQPWAYCWALYLFGRAVGIELDSPAMGDREAVIVVEASSEENHVLHGARRRALPADGR